MIPTDDLLIEYWPPRNVGGQHVGVTTGIKVTHLPTEVSAFVNIHRSSHKNKEIAIDMILAAVTHPKA